MILAGCDQEDEQKVKTEDVCSFFWLYFLD